MFKFGGPSPPHDLAFGARLHFRDFVPWTIRQGCALLGSLHSKSLQSLFAIPQLLLQPVSFVLCFPQRFVGFGQPVPRFLDKLGTSRVARRQGSSSPPVVPSRKHRATFWPRDCCRLPMRPLQSVNAQLAPEPHPFGTSNALHPLRGINGHGSQGRKKISRKFLR